MMSYTGNKGRVLLANTDAMFLKGLRSHLEGAGYEVVFECSNGNDALKKATELHPDALILGLMLPGGGICRKSRASRHGACLHNHDFGCESFDVRRGLICRRGILYYAAVRLWRITHQVTEGAYQAIMHDRNRNGRDNSNG